MAVAAKVSKEELELSKAIIHAAIEGGYLEADDVPDEEAAFVEHAAYLAEEAGKWTEKGLPTNDTIETIIQLVETFQQLGGVFNEGAEEAAEAEPEEGAETEPEAEPEEEPAQEEAPVDPVAETYPRRSSGGLSESDEREGESYLERQNLPIPKEIQDDPTEMPRDLTAVSDIGIRKLHGEYAAFLARAKWLLTVELRDLENAKHIRESAYRAAFLAANQGDKKLVKVIEAEAEENEIVVDWDTKIAAHQSSVTTFKGLVEIYSSNVSALSREWTMRQDEYNKTR